jgi:hypothetical protein
MMNKGYYISKAEPPQDLGKMGSYDWPRNEAEVSGPPKPTQSSIPLQDVDNWEESRTSLKNVTTQFEVDLLSKPAFTGEVLERLPADTKLSVLSETGAWLKVKHNNREGFVAKSWVEATPIM